MYARDIAAEDPQLVLPKRAADLKARFDNHVLVFVGHVVFGSGVEPGGGVQRRQRRVSRQAAVCVVGVEGIALEVGQQRSVPLVGALLGKHVDHATQGAAELGFEAAGLDLNLVDELHLVALTDATVLDVGDVDAIHHVDVFAVAGAIDLVAADRAGSNAALQGFPAGTRSERNEGLEGAALGKVVQDLLFHGHGDLTLGRVHHGCGAGDLHGFGDGAYFEFHVHGRQAADGQVNADLLEGTKSGRRHR